MSPSARRLGDPGQRLSALRGPSPTRRRAAAPGRDGASSLRVRAARARIASGYYDRDDVRETLVGAILEELGRS